MKSLFNTLFLGVLLTISTHTATAQKVSVKTAETLLENIMTKYNFGQYHLLTESYPPKSASISYTVEQNQNKTEIAYLWPYSGTLSASIALYKETKNPQHLQFIETSILPGLEEYWDNKRTPACYQSFPTRYGDSDRYYDDNIWIAIDFCHLYTLTRNNLYLEKAQQLYRFILSGWDDQLGGGIYWCEQKKSTKNCCSNAPTAVLASLLYSITNEKHYLEQAINTYAWTKKLFLDTSDYTYWDSMTLSGKISKAKYAYNTGQMIQAGALLYKATGDKQYLLDAQTSVKQGNSTFCAMTADGNAKLRLYKDDTWFNAIYFRGINELNTITKQKEVIKLMKQNLVFAWNKRDTNGFINTKWHEAHQPHKWLLANAAFVELIVAAYGTNQ